MDASAPPYDAPPSYEEVIRGFFHVPELSGLSVVDFLPENDTIRFPTLVARANEWLRIHPLWQAKSCESVEFKSKQGFPRVDRVTFLEHDTRTAYVRALRLWLIPRIDPSQLPQQIGYLNVVPKLLEDGWINRKFERLDSVLLNLNNHLSTNPLEGKILCVETQPMKFSTSQHAVDPDKTYFHDFGFSVCVLRIFYEIGSPHYETVCIEDFIPNCEMEEGCCTQGLYSSIPETVASIKDWCRRNETLRICNIQTVQLVKKFNNDFDSKKMSIKEYRSDDHVTTYIKVLRIAGVWSKVAPPPVVLPAPITCKIFLPVQLTSFRFGTPPEFESTQQTLTRIAEWCKIYNVKIISAETTALRMYPYDVKNEGPTSSIVINKAGHGEFFIFYFTLYLEGEYPDPPIMMCPISHRGWRRDPVTSADNIPPPPDNYCSIL